jgi:asparagine synthase (glutamine-hydrolysing)
MKNRLNIADPLLRIINIELKNRLPELLLMRVDKMSMAQSIETRVPFLDVDLVEFALQIPSQLKFRKGETKYILKKAAEGILPDDIIYRQKMGFCGSATSMLSDKLTKFARETVLSSTLAAELFNRPYLEQLFANHEAQKRFNSFKIWNLLNLVLWHNCWFNPKGDV